MRRWILAVAALVLASLPAFAQEAPKRREVEALVSILEDEGARAKLIEQLKLLMQASAPETGAAEAVEQEIDAALKTVSERLAGLRASFGAILGQLRDLRHLGAWLAGQVGGSAGRAFWGEALIDLAMGAGAGAAAQVALWWALKGPRRRLAGLQPPRRVQRVLPSIAVLLLDLAPILAFGVAAYGAMLARESPDRARVLLLAVVNAHILATAVSAIGRAAFRPRNPGLRVLALRDTAAVYLFAVLRRASAVLIYGAFVLEAALALGLPREAYAGGQNLLGLIALGQLLHPIWRHRQAVAAAIVGRAAATEEATLVAATRQGIAGLWHVLATIWLVALYAIWVLKVPDGFAAMLRGSLGTLAAVAAMLASRGLLDRWVERLRERSGAKAGPALSLRVTRYAGLGRRVLGVLIQLMALVLILESWSIEALAWLIDGGGRRMVDSVGMVAAVALVALGLFEAASVAMENQVARLVAADDMQRANRLKTIFPMTRVGIGALLAAMAVLIVLANFGVNILPLLAGASVLGVAIGLGAQNMVRDMIGGISVLVDNTISVGDTIEIAGRQGRVEKLGLKAVKLRDIAGNLHTIALSGVGPIANMTRDFSYAMIELPTAGMTLDRALGALEAAEARLRKDPEIERLLRGRVEVWAMDRVTAEGTTIKARIMTRPAKQWKVQRRFYRALARVLVESGAETASAAGAKP
ncbi:MAG: mechanosensitive ion channel [Alphaproteobacteria bacterium]|nr:mechanosensitive ion channel [Alphaproteobacteria bacterium]